MTGIGAYMYIIWGIQLRHCLNGQQDDYQLRWARIWHFPDVVRIAPPSDGKTAREKKSS